MIVNILTIITAFDCRPAGGKHSIVSLSSIIRLKRFVNQAREREREGGEQRVVKGWKHRSKQIDPLDLDIRKRRDVTYRHR